MNAYHSLTSPQAAAVTQPSLLAYSQQSMVRSASYELIETKIVQNCPVFTHCYWGFVNQLTLLSFQLLNTVSLCAFRQPIQPADRTGQHPPLNKSELAQQ